MEIRTERGRVAAQNSMRVNHRKLSIGQLVFGGIVALILVFLVLPTLIVAPISFSDARYLQFPPTELSLRWYAEYFTDKDWVAATLFSARIALSTTLAATVVGALAAVALVRGSFPGKSIVLGLALSPLLLPHIVIAIALYLFFAPLKLTGNFFGFLLAHTMLAVPYVVISVSASLQKFDSTLELAALNCGANRVQAFFTIVLPNILPGVFAGGIFAFISSFDEATVAFFISGIDGKTITRKLFEDIDFSLTPVIAVVATLLVLVSLLLLGVYQFVQSKMDQPKHS